VIPYTMAGRWVDRIPALAREMHFLVIGILAY